MKRTTRRFVLVPLIALWVLTNLPLSIALADPPVICDFDSNLLCFYYLVTVKSPLSTTSSLPTVVPPLALQPTSGGCGCSPQVTSPPPPDLPPPPQYELETSEVPVTVPQGGGQSHADDKVLATYCRSEGVIEVRRKGDGWQACKKDPD